MILTRVIGALGILKDFYICNILVLVFLFKKITNNASKVLSPNFLIRIVNVFPIKLRSRHLKIN